MKESPSLRTIVAMFHMGSTVVVAAVLLMSIDHGTCGDATSAGNLLTPPQFFSVSLGNDVALGLLLISPYPETRSGRSIPRRIIT